MHQHSKTIVEIEGKRFEIPDQSFSSLNAHVQPNDKLEIRHENLAYEFQLIEYNPLTRECAIEINGQLKRGKIIRDIDLRIETLGLNMTQSKKLSTLVSPMPGLVTRIEVKEGDNVEKGQPLVILEAMKMENVISAPQAATIKNIRVQVGQAVERGLVLMEFI
ncbi:MAG: acetyl-CoA carboxylase biotin carboxyl carrier protein subunit [Saprospiraceae bacterium]